MTGTGDRALERPGARAEASDPGGTGRKMRENWLDGILRFCLENKLVVGLLLGLAVGWGVLVAPFDWEFDVLERHPVPVDAIPDIGENQQIVFTEWMGRSPQDVEDQITYPLTVALLGTPGVRTVRSFSFFGFSSVYVIFNEDVEFYWSRSRLLEKLASLPAGTLPEGVQPTLGPDATALGQVFWYTLQGLDPEGRPTGGWDLEELRSIQDWTVRYALASVEGIAEVASVGGMQKEYQVDVDPDAMRAFGVTLPEVFRAVRRSNLDVGARTIEVNQVEYVVRGVGFLKSIEDLENSVIRVTDNVPVYLRNVAHVTLGPALRRGALDLGGAEAVGGVAVVRYGENPLVAIQRLKAKIVELQPGLPQKILEDGTRSQISIVPFYDRTELIHETLNTLEKALSEEILVTILVVVVMVWHLRASLLIAGLIPLAVLLTFIAMREMQVDANIVALSGIAIAIGTMVDMGIVLVENILEKLQEAPPEASRQEVVFQASSEVGSAVLTAIATTVVSFLPVFAMEAAEGKLFQPLAWTKTFALLASVLVALLVLPMMAHLFLARNARRDKNEVSEQPGFFQGRSGSGRPEDSSRHLSSVAKVLVILVTGLVLAGQWLPLGPESGRLGNFAFIALLLGGILGALLLLQRFYEPLLHWCLEHQKLFLAFPVALVLWGMTIWLGFSALFGWVPASLESVGLGNRWLVSSRPWSWATHAFPGLGKEFMPDLDEGQFLYMPTTMPHASLGEALDVLSKLDRAIQSVPEVEQVVGKLGRAESPLDPAPISMFESIVRYKDEYRSDARGNHLSFRYDREKDDFVRDANGQLIPDPGGRPFRQWRPEIRSVEDIWQEITQAAQIPGTTSAPKLQPIAARIVMLQSGMRAPMGIKVRGPDLPTLESFGLELERLLKQVPSVEPAAVLADRIVGKPYLEIVIDREACARHGIQIQDVADVLEIAVGGKRITSTVEGRERYGVRVRYLRELRNDIESLGRILVASPSGVQIPLVQLAEVRYQRGPQVIKSEDTFLTGYVLFDKKPGHAEVEVVEDCQRFLQSQIDSGELVVPAGVSYAFAGSYENQVRSDKRLRVLLPVALAVIFLLLYLQFRSVSTSLMVFAGVLVAWSGGFQMLWLYGQSWFLDVSVFGANLRELFHIAPVNLSVAVWVGFLALFGIATDDGVVMATYLDQSFARRQPQNRSEIREAVLQGALRRIRPCLMTSGTTILALLPVLTSTGRGSDILVPMAIPVFGGMTVVLLTVFVVPTFYAMVQELRWLRNSH